MEAWEEILIAYAVVFLCAVPKFAYVIRKMGPNLERIVRKTGMHKMQVENGDQLIQEISRRFDKGEYPLHCAQFGPYGKFRLYMHHFLITSIVPDVDGESMIEIQEYDAGWGAKFCKPFWGRVQREKVKPNEFLHHARALWTIPHPNLNEQGGVPCDIRKCIDRRLKWRTREPFWRLTYNNCEHYATWVTTGQHRSAQFAEASFSMRYSAHGLLTRAVLVLAQMQFLAPVAFRTMFYLSSLFIFNIGSDVAAFASIFLGELCLMIWELNIISYVEGSHLWPTCVRWFSLGPCRYRMQVFQGTQRRKKNRQRQLLSIDKALREGEPAQGEDSIRRSMLDIVAEVTEDAADALMTAATPADIAADAADDGKEWRHPHAQIFWVARIQRFLSCMIMSALTGFGAVYGHRMWNHALKYSILAEIAGAILFLLIAAIFVYPLAAAMLEHTFYKYDGEKIGWRTILVAIFLLTISLLLFLCALGSCIMWRFRHVFEFDDSPSSLSHNLTNRRI